MYTPKTVDQQYAQQHQQQREYRTIYTCTQRDIAYLYIVSTHKINNGHHRRVRVIRAIIIITRPAQIRII